MNPKVGLGLDLGGTSLKIGLVWIGELLETQTIAIPSNQSFAQTMEEVGNCALNLLGKHFIRPKEVAGIGLALPGIVNPYEKRVLSINEKHAGAVQFEFEEWAAQLGFATIAIENDARAALIGEATKGAAKAAKDIVMVTFGTGIGVAVMLNGTIQYGKHFQLGSLTGHFVIDFHGPTCNCGGIGCAEAHASGWKLPSLIQQDPLYTPQAWPATALHFEQLILRYQAGHPLAIKIGDECMKAWAACLINLVYAYDPEIIVLGGGIMQNHEFWIPKLHELMTAYAWEGTHIPPLEPASLGNSAAILGMVQQLHTP